MSQNGYFPYRAIPVSRAMPAKEFGSGLGMNESSDSEDEVYGDQYSPDSSPQDEKFTNVAQFSAPFQRRVNSGGNFSSTGHPNWKEVGHGMGAEGPVSPRRYIDEEDSKRPANSEFYPVKTKARVGGLVVERKMYPSVGFSSMAAKQEFIGRGKQTKKPYDGEIPSAPPFLASSQEINGVATQFTTSTAPSMSNSSASSVAYESKTAKSMLSESDATAQDSTRNRIAESSGRIPSGVEATVSPPLPARLPTFHASGKGPWCAVISYDACVRLCLHLWYMGRTEAQIFLNNECSLLRNAFGLQQVLLQPEEELLAKQPSELATEQVILKPRKTTAKLKVQVRKVKMDLDLPTGCTFASLKSRKIKMETFRSHLSNLKSTLSSGLEALRKVRVSTDQPNGSFSQKSLSYFQAGMKEVFEILKSSVTTLRNSSTSYEVVPETYSCLLKLKSSLEVDAMRMQPGSGETHMFFPDSLGDDLLIEVQDSKGKKVGHVRAQVALIADDPSDKLRWWSIYWEPDHELVGRIQLYIDYSSRPDETGLHKGGCVAETVAYDLVLEIAMKVQHFQQRNLLLHDPWKWLLNEFASYYGVSDAYARLRYLSYIMDVATPTSDCLVLVHDLLYPVLIMGDSKSCLSHQENRILGEIVDQLEQTIALVFENYKSLDESSMSGMMDTFRPATGVAPPALEPATKLYTLLHDILSPEAQLKLCRYLQVAAKKRSRKHLAETDEFVSGSNDTILMDPAIVSTVHQEMKSLCLSMRNEILTDIEIHNQQIFPSFVDLPNLSSSIYSMELCSRIRAFLVACPPSGPSHSVVELVIATADFQRDLASWEIDHVKGGVDAKDLFHSYISRWILDKRITLLDLCKLEKVKWSGVRTQYSTTPFVDDMYDRMMQTLDEYEVIISRWPEYIFAIKSALVDVEKAIVDALDKQYIDVLSPLKELASKKFGLKYVQTIAKGTVSTYAVPEELGIMLNSMKRMMDVLRPKIESRLRSWIAYIPDGEKAVSGDNLSEITVMLRAKFRKYLQAIVEKLFANTRMHNTTRLDKVIRDSKEIEAESDVRCRMQTLKDLLTDTIDHLHVVFSSQVFATVCLGFWERMGQEILKTLENRGENRSWYRGLRIAVSVVDDVFLSRMQQLQGNALWEEDIPESIKEVRSMLFKDI